MFSKTRYDAVETWCHVGLAPLFVATPGTANLGKFARKLIICGIRRNDVAEIYALLPNVMPFCKDDTVLTSYLLFKVSLLS